MITVNGYMPTINKFGNGETQVVLNKKLYGANRFVVEWLYQGDEEIMQLRQIHSLIKTHQMNAQVTCVIPYFPYERMDRVADDNPFSLREMVELLPHDDNWTYSVVEPHSNVLAEQFERAKLALDIRYFNSTVYTDVLDGVLGSLTVFPDKGSVKRYLNNKDSQMMRTITQHIKFGGIFLVGSKERDFHTKKLSNYVVKQQLALDADGNIVTVDWNPEGARDSIYQTTNNGNDFKIRVIDDVVSYGNTFNQLAGYMKKTLENSVFSDEFKHNGLKFELYVAHMEPSVFKGDLLDYFDKIYTTNSITGGTVFTPFSEQFDVSSVRNLYTDLQINTFYNEEDEPAWTGQDIPDENTFNLI